MNSRLRNKWTKRIFPFIAFLLLLPWPIAYAANVDATASQDPIKIEIAQDSLKPAYTVFGRAIGGVSHPGDLFYIDATNNTVDIVATLSLTNAPELINHYRYLLLNVGVYVENGGEWVRASGSNGELIANTIISMRNGQVSFLLPGYAKYKLTIDSGAFYATNVNADESSLAPWFYLEVN